MTTNVLIGPPGTGKTTTLLNRIEALLHNRVSPERIAFVSFTKSACAEAKERACDRFCFEPEQLPWFRTIHSMAFHLIGGKTVGKVMTDADWKDFGEYGKYDFSNEGGADTPFFTSFTTDGDKFRSVYDASRVRLCSIDQAILACGTNVRADHVAEYAKRLTKYKLERNAVDFTDMLERALKTDRKPGADVAFVDESQDLCALQWALIHHWFIRSGRNVATTIAGDDDQSIFTFAGAEPDTLIRLANENETTYLDQSYRIPATVHSLANQIIGQNSNRLPKQYKPRAEAGAISIVRDASDVFENRGQSTLMLLVRNIYIANQDYESALSRGEYFSSEVGRKAPLERAGIKGAYLAVACLRQNGTTFASHFSHLLDQVPSKIEGKSFLPHGVKTKADANRLPVSVQRAVQEFGLGDFMQLLLASEHPCRDTLLRLSREEQTYLDKVLARYGAALPAKFDVEITTMHRSKGREADIVSIRSDMATKSFAELKSADPDTEHRLAYVAATRTKKHLYLVRPETSKFYPYEFHATMAAKVKP